MDIHVNVINQRLKISRNIKSVVAGSNKFVRFVFHLSDDWNGLTTIVKFIQNGSEFTTDLDEGNAVYLPNEIIAGDFTIGIRGIDSDRIATTSPITMHAYSPGKE